MNRRRSCWTVSSLCAVLLLCIPCGLAPARRAGAEVRVSAWMLVLHEAETRDAAQAWATAHCASAAPASYCGDTWNDGALEARFGIYAAADWPGVDTVDWFVGLGPVRSRRHIREVQSALEDAGVTSTLHRLPALPRVQEWAAGTLSEWRVWTLRGPVSQQEVLYLSRTDQPDLELARGWPLPQENGGAELYAIGMEPDGNTFYYFHADAPHGVDVSRGTVSSPSAPAQEDTVAVLAAAAGHLEPGASLQVLWVLPFAAAVSQNLVTEEGGWKRRVLRLGRTEGAWDVVGEELQVRLAPPVTADSPAVDSID